jgi:hypothetical protein
MKRLAALLCLASAALLALATFALLPDDARRIATLLYFLVAALQVGCAQPESRRLRPLLNASILR